MRNMLSVRLIPRLMVNMLLISINLRVMVLRLLINVLLLRMRRVLLVVKKILFCRCIKILLCIWRKFSVFLTRT